MELGYARVSTSKQDLDRQITTLHEHGIRDALLWVDKRTGAHTDREGLAGILAAAQEGDTIVTCTLDRLGRNLRDCLNLVHDLSQRGVQLRTLHDPLPIDTADTSAMAQISTAMLALFSEVERVFSQERAAHARSVREAKGVPAGRRRKLTEQQLAAAAAQVEAGVPVPQVAATFQVSRSSMYRLLGERDTGSAPAETPAPSASTSSEPAAPAAAASADVPAASGESPRAVAPGELVDPDTVTTERDPETGISRVTGTGRDGSPVLVGFLARTGRQWQPQTPHKTARGNPVRTKHEALLRLLAEHTPSHLSVPSATLHTTEDITR